MLAERQDWNLCWRTIWLRWAGSEQSVLALKSTSVRVCAEHPALKCNKYANRSAVQLGA